MATSVWSLHESTTPAIPAAAAQAAERRRATRRPLAVGRASVWDVGGTAGEARLLDLSVYGCRLTIAEALTEGDRLWLRFDGGWPVAASVVWADDTRVGCRFDKPIPGTMMRELARALI